MAEVTTNNTGGSPRKRVSSRRVGFYLLLGAFLAVVITNLINNKNVPNSGVLSALVTLLTMAFASIFGQKRMDGTAGAASGTTKPPADG